MKRSMRRASFGDRYAATSKFFTSPAIWLESGLASKCVMRPMPDLAARTLDQASATVLPIGQTIPKPVTTTRRRLKSTPAVGESGFLGVSVHVVDGLLDRGDLFGFLIRNLRLEFLFESHHEFDGVERVRAEVVDKRGSALDLRIVHPELFRDDFFDALFNVFHCGLLPPCFAAIEIREVRIVAESPFLPASRSSRNRDSITVVVLRLSAHVHAAVDVNGRAGDVGGLRRGEKSHHGGHVLRFSEAPQGNLLKQRPTLRLGQRSGHVGVDKAGRNAVDGDAAAADLPRERPRHARDAGLRRRIVDLTGVSARTDHRGDVDDAARTRFHHAAQYRLGELEHGFEIGVDHRVPLGSFMRMARLSWAMPALLTRTDTVP